MTSGTEKGDLNGKDTFIYVPLISLSLAHTPGTGLKPAKGVIVHFIIS